MNKNKIRQALQDLIYRLQDAEKGYLEIKLASSNVIVNNWLQKYARERHEMHKELEHLSTQIGGDPSVKTTFLGSLHRMFIDIKINNVNAENEFKAIVTEIERGATSLINDYTKVLSDVEMPANYVTKLMSQKVLIQEELNNLVDLREEIYSSESQ